MCTLTRGSQVKYKTHNVPIQSVSQSCTCIKDIVEHVFLPTGDLENRAVIREPATLLITNATRSDTAKYRCEVTAANDQKSFDEILIDLVVRGELPVLLINLCECVLRLENMWSQRYEIDL